MNGGYDSKVDVTESWKLKEEFRVKTINAKPSLFRLSIRLRISVGAISKFSC